MPMAIVDRSTLLEAPADAVWAAVKTPSAFRTVTRRPVTMPVIGDPETMNDTFIDQIVGAAKAAIDKAVEMGVDDLPLLTLRGPLGELGKQIDRDHPVEIGDGVRVAIAKQG